MCVMDLKAFLLSFSSWRWGVCDPGCENCVAGEHQLALRSGRSFRWAPMVSGSSIVGDRDEKHDLSGP